jgi:hypothetical protein
VAPTPTDGLAGVTAIDTNVAGVTVSITGDEDLPPRVAVMEDVPTAAELTNPTGLTAATVEVPDDQVTWEVRSWVD